MAEIKAAQVWLTEEVLRRIKQHPRTSSGPVGSFVAVANTPENIEAIKKAAITLTSVRYRCGEPVNETDVRNDLLAVLGLTGGGE